MAFDSTTVAGRDIAASTQTLQLHGSLDDVAIRAHREEMKPLDSSALGGGRPIILWMDSATAEPDDGMPVAML